ncbi:tripartite tricarboxylate transporter TctB family protein [Reyranella sp.]|uniref:tripartite tricarboxylate transporter TctB family protein n=1 Tax=Reyranella sp. TaxID=1929291 RepID=UPI003BAC12F1
MTHPADEPATRGPRQHLVEAGVAAFMILLGLVTIAGSLKVGTGWGAEGPMSGFFPFWIGLIVVATSAFNLVRALSHGSRRTFATWGELGQVLKVVVPLTLYVAAIPWLGIYLSSALLIAGFMRWIGRYGWLLTLAISLGLPVLAYVTFEIWFLVPLPKGPIEDWLGL